MSSFERFLEIARDQYPEQSHEWHVEWAKRTAKTHPGYAKQRRFDVRKAALVAWRIALLAGVLFLCAKAAYSQVRLPQVNIKGQNATTSLFTYLGGSQLTLKCDGTGLVCSYANGVLTMTGAAGGSGEANTASNFGAVGTGLWKDKSGVDLRFRKVASANSLLSIAPSGDADDYVNLTVNQGNFTLSSIGGAVTDAQVPDTITLDNITQITNRAISNTTGTLTETRGGTNQTTYTLGDILYASAANTLAKQAGNTTTTKQFLTQTGTGTVSAAPAWGTIAVGDLPSHRTGMLHGFCTGTATASTTIYFGGGFGSAVTTCTGATLTGGTKLAGSGTLRNFSVNFGTAGKNAANAATVVKGGTATAVTCTFGTSTTCSDTANSVAFVTGDVITVRFTTAASETAANGSFSLEIW